MKIKKPDEYAWCPRCKRDRKLIQKMGGWICSVCRRVLKSS